MRFLTFVSITVSRNLLSSIHVHDCTSQYACRRGLFPTFCSNIFFYWPVCRFSVSNGQITSILAIHDYIVQQKIASLPRVIMLYMLYNAVRDVIVPMPSVRLSVHLYSASFVSNVCNFLADLHNYARSVWPRMTEYGTITQVEEKHISRGWLRPRLQGRGPATRIVFEILTAAQTVRSRETKFGIVTHVRCSVFLWHQLQRPPKFWGSICAQKQPNFAWSN